MTIYEAIEILEEKGYTVILNEDLKNTAGKIFGIGALAASTALGNSNINANPINHPDFGKNSTVHLHDRYNLDSDRYGVPKTYKLQNDKSPYKISEKDEIDLTKKKILATPPKMLRKYGKENVDVIAKYMVNTANKYNIDIDILLAMAATESNFDNNAKSGAGAIGMMQITKTAAYDNHVRLQKKDKESFNFEDLKDLKTNIDNAGRMVANLSKRYGNIVELIWAAYNGGRRQCTALKAYMSNNKYDKDGNEAPVLAAETKGYISKCLHLYKLYKQVQKENKV